MFLAICQLCRDLGRRHQANSTAGYLVRWPVWGPLRTETNTGPLEGSEEHCQERHSPRKEKKKTRRAMRTQVLSICPAHAKLMSPSQNMHLTSPIPSCGGSFHPSPARCAVAVSLTKRVSNLSDPGRRRSEGHLSCIIHPPPEDEGAKRRYISTKSSINHDGAVGLFWNEENIIPLPFPTTPSFPPLPPPSSMSKCVPWPQPPAIRRKIISISLFFLFSWNLVKVVSSPSPPSPLTLALFV